MNLHIVAYLVDIMLNEVKCNILPAFDCKMALQDAIRHAPSYSTYDMRDFLTKSMGKFEETKDISNG